MSPFLEKWIQAQAQLAKAREDKRRTRVAREPSIFDPKPARGTSHPHWSEKK